MADILVVDDNTNLVRFVRDRLVKNGHQVETAADGKSGLDAASKGIFDVIILDVSMPELDGFEVCRRLRAQGVGSAILMLTAAVQVDDRVHGLRIGADDYLTKPFDMAELLARVDALLRRVSPPSSSTLGVITVGDLELDFAAMRVRRGGEEVELSALELRLLRYLADRRGRIVTRQELLAGVWRHEEVTPTRTVDVRIAALRQKLETDPARPVLIVTVHRYGYKLNA
jgi:two-component system, OmpR family, alkaline phosphatase synthesis response regulator PhoP